MTHTQADIYIYQKRLLVIGDGVYEWVGGGVDGRTGWTAGGRVDGRERAQRQIKCCSFL